MDLTRYGHGCVAFLVAMVGLLVHDVVGMYAHPEWAEGIPAVFHPLMPLLVNVGLPVVFLVVAFGILHALQHERRGFIITLGIGVFSVVLNVPVTYWRIKAGFYAGATICGVEALAGGIAISYALGGLRTLRVALSAPEPTAAA